MTILDSSGSPYGHNEGGTRKGPVQTLMESAGEFGLVCVLPHPRRQAPQQFVAVTDTDIKPDQDYGTITYTTTTEESGLRFERNDLIIHQETGAICRVVEGYIRHGFKTARVQALMAPPTEADRTAWLVNNGKGNWVCLGRAWSDWSEAPKQLRVTSQTASTAEDIEAARYQTFENPERKGWQEQGFHVGKPLSKMNKHDRRKAKMQLRSLFRGQQQVKQVADLDAHIEQNADQTFETAGGGRVRRWTLGG